MSLTPDVESTPSVAKLYEYPEASIYSYLFLRRVWSVLNVYSYVGSRNSCRIFLSITTATGQG